MSDKHEIGCVAGVDGSSSSSLVVVARLVSTWPLLQDLHIRIINAATGELLRELTLDPTRRSAAESAAPNSGTSPSAKIASRLGPTELAVLGPAARFVQGPVF